MNDLVVTDVRCIPGDSGFLIDDGETAILYDTGFGFTGYQMAEKIKEILKERKLNFIFLTHSHYDHALGSPYILRYYPEAKVVAGRYAAGVFARPGALKTMETLDRSFAAYCGITEYDCLVRELRVDIACDDGDVIEAGKMRFQVIDLPGHTSCSVGYYCKEKELLLATESLGVYDGDKTIVPAILKSYLDTCSSIERVRNISVKTMLSPHFGILTEEQTAYFLNHMKTCTEKTAAEIVKCLREGKTIEQMLENFKEEYWKGTIKEKYPIDAFNLNTTIMIKTIQKELLGE